MRKLTTPGGNPVSLGTPAQQLERAVSSYFLFDKDFSENGQAMNARIQTLAESLEPDFVAYVARQARAQGLRKVSFLLASILAKTASGTDLPRKVLQDVLQRPDDISHFLEIHAARHGVPPQAVKKILSAQIKKGVAKVFTRFNAHQLAKANAQSKISVRDALFLTHPKPISDQQKQDFQQLANNTLPVPRTWETLLSAGADKKATFESLLKEKALGGLALLRNLRLMTENNVHPKLIESALCQLNDPRIEPFRYFTAAQHAPQFSKALETAMMASLSPERLPGHTVIVCDVSGSMGQTLVSTSQSDRMQAAAALSVIGSKLCESSSVYWTAGSDHARKHQTRRSTPQELSFAGVQNINAICHELGGGGIFLTQVLRHIASLEHNIDRVIVITDEQDCAGSAESPDKAPLLGRHNYMMNVASTEYGIGQQGWTRIFGFSAQLYPYIQKIEHA